MKILAFDPSGNFYEGKGTTGWALFYNGELKAVGQIRADECETRFEYWEKHLILITTLEPNHVVIEDFILYASKKEKQIGSEFETPQLIGVLKYYCDKEVIPWHLQHAQIKSRYSNKILLYKQIISKSGTRYYAAGVPVSGHILDAIRHGMFFITFRLPKIKEELNESTT
jgi:hypothetical protein